MKPENEEAMRLATDRLGETDATEDDGFEPDSAKVARHVRRLVEENERMRKALTRAAAETDPHDVMAGFGLEQAAKVYHICHEALTPTPAVEAKPQPGDKCPTCKGTKTVEDGSDGPNRIAFDDCPDCTTGPGGEG